jgi:hypothetical protein
MIINVGATRLIQQASWPSLSSAANQIHPPLKVNKSFLNPIHTAGDGGVLHNDDATAFRDLVRSGLDKPQPPLDALDAEVHPVHAVRQARILHFQDAEAFLDLVYVVDELGQRSLDRFKRFEQ